MSTIKDISKHLKEAIDGNYKGYTVSPIDDGLKLKSHSFKTGGRKESG